MITQNRTALNQLTAVLPDDGKVIMSSLLPVPSLYTLGEDEVLTNNQTHVKYRPNNVGFYQSINADAGAMKRAGTHCDYRLGQLYPRLPR